MKALLKTGMLVQHRNGFVGKILFGTGSGDYVMAGPDKIQASLSGFDADLRSNTSSGLDIVKIFAPNDAPFVEGMSREGYHQIWRRHSTVDMKYKNIKLEEECQMSDIKELSDKDITIQGASIRKAKQKSLDKYAVYLTTSDDTEIFAGSYPSRQSAYKMVEMILDLIIGSQEGC